MSYEYLLLKLKCLLFIENIKKFENYILKTIGFENITTNYR